jgi:hypothetical protein
MWTKAKLLIWGKTYPEFSKTYFETVCTGALDAATGRLIRIYPIRLRYMKEPFRLFDWIEAEIERNASDFRPESFRIREDSIKIVGHIDTKKKDWLERRRWMLGDQNAFASVEALQGAEALDHTSLGLVRPKEIKRIYLRKKPDSERQEWEAQRAIAMEQRELFVDEDTLTRDLHFMPIEYRVRFACNDPACIGEHDFSIRDWGVYVLSRREYAQRGPQVAESKVIEKINELMDPTTRDPYFFLGNTKAHPKNFMIVGFFHPPREKSTTPMLPGLGLDGE